MLSLIYWQIVFVECISTATPTRYISEEANQMGTAQATECCSGKLESHA